MRDHDYTTSSEFLAEFFGPGTEHAVELRSLPNDRGAGPNRPLFGRDLTLVEAHCQRWDGTGRAMYFGVCTRITGTPSGTRADLAECPALWAEVDTRKLGLDKAMVRQVVVSLPHPPSLVIDSGGGLHFYWLLTEAIDVRQTSENAAETEEAVVAVLKQLAGIMAGDTSVCDLARIMRLPGSHNTKPEVMATNSGLPAPVTVLSADWQRRHEFSDLVDWLDWQRPVIAAPILSAKDTPTTEDNPYLAAASRLGFKPPLDVERALAAMSYLGNGDSGIHQTQLRVSASLVTQGVAEDEIVTLLMAGTLRVAGNHARTWNWRREERAIRSMVASARVKFAKPAVVAMPVRAAAAGAQGGAEVHQVIDLGRERKKRRKPPRSAKSAEKTNDWYSRCLETAAGGVLSNLANAILALREDPAWSGVFAYDQMAHETLLEAAIPRHDGSPAVVGPFPRPITDADVGAVQEWLQIAGLTKLSKDTTHQAVDMRANENAFHPVRAYLDSLRWDGVKRLAGDYTGDFERIPPWLTRYLGAEDSPYTASIGSMFFIALVARILEPGCKVDTMLILEGPQGAMKSTACSIIGGRWFSDTMPENVASKDSAQHLRGKWLIELGELHALSKAETSSLKAFVTRTAEVYRPAYGRKEVHEPRQCLFIGTTNKAAYLRDETGGRRFWPVTVGVARDLDIAALAADRDQLFAEAVQRFRAGERWWPDRAFEAEHIKPEQEARYETDAWEDALAEYTQDKPRVTVLEAARGALFMETAKLGTADQRRITGILERLGWTRGKRSGAARWWVPTTTGREASLRTM